MLKKLPSRINANLAASRYGIERLLRSAHRDQLSNTISDLAVVEIGGKTSSARKLEICTFHRNASKFGLKEKQRSDTWPQ
jgi:hypothetical protein